MDVEAPNAVSSTRPERRESVDARGALITATEGILIESGYAAITVRSVAARAGVNHGLVHYYFSSLHDLLLQTLEQFTERLIERQSQMYTGDGRFIDKWRAAMRFLDEDADSGYHKIWFELQAMSWNDRSMRARLIEVHQRWIEVLTHAFDLGLRELGVDRRHYPTRSIVALVVTFNEGLMLEGLADVDSGRRALLQMVDTLIERLTAEASGARAIS